LRTILLKIVKNKNNICPSATNSPDKNLYLSPDAKINKVVALSSARPITWKHEKTETTAPLIFTSKIV
jgi:hypothetical protein